MNIGNHPLDHIVSMAESIDFAISSASQSNPVKADYSTIACIACVTGCEGTFSSLLPSGWGW